jgi:hypothetical protein
MAILLEKSPTQVGIDDPNHLGEPPVTRRRAREWATDPVEELIDWSTDPAGLDRKAMENVNRDGWGIER